MVDYIESYLAGETKVLGMTGDGLMAVGEGEDGDSEERSLTLGGWT